MLCLHCSGRSTVVNMEAEFLNLGLDIITHHCPVTLSQCHQTQVTALLCSSLMKEGRRSSTWTWTSSDLVPFLTTALFE
jgi:hypothetical protein